MCSRFELNAPREEIARLFDDVPLPDDLPGGEIRPTNRALVVATGNLALIPRWGIAAPWDGKPLINARLETVAEKATFRPLLANRCLVPATAYFEWRVAGSGQRLRNRIFVPGTPVMAFAGLHDGERFTILTCDPAPGIAHIHNRMPVILIGGAMGSWLEDLAPADLPHPFPGRLAADEDAPAQGELF